ncbi:hypothetical protein JCM33374_g730 [Metschnikowia sp. JCM 33374]|nr:hypothetical protein JCM33374_g730 [Metschnikowia sp. JCM 33374]
MLEIKPRTSVPPTSLQRNGNEEAGTNTSTGTETTRPGPTGGNNKHNLRISNFGSVNSDRLPGLTPPVFTPGGRRLPPIHLSPGIGMSSPGTPGSNLWSSLLTATNGAGTGQSGEQNPGTYAPPNYPSYMRKSGLIPTESNLRSGLTPGIMAHNGFNFNLQDSMTSGQMTPGLQTLLGLVNSNPVENHSLPSSAAPNPGSNPLYQPSQASVNGPLHSVATQETHQKGALKDGENEQTKPDGPKKEQPKSSKKRPHKPDDLTNKVKVQKTSKSSVATKVKNESAEESKESKDEDDGLDEEEKRKQFLERNRVAALKCRQRKKQLLNKMESELAFYSDGYRDLTAQVSQLRNQVMTLRGILINHKDCPALSNSVGGYQQLQSILAQAECLALGGKNPAPNYVPLPTTIPTLLNNPQPMPKPSGQIVMNGQGHMQQLDHSVNGLGSNDVMHNIHAHNGQNPVHNDTLPGHQNRDQIAFEEDLAMSRQYSSADGHQSGVEMHQLNKDNLRPVNSTSNLQHAKNESHISGYDLRPIASMADLQHQNNNSGMMARQFQL